MATSEAQSKSLIFQAQYLVAEQLNRCEDLSATPFWPEDMLDIEFQIHEALSKQGIACTVMTPQLAYQGMCGESTAWDFSNLQLVVVENPQINRARENAMTALDVGYVAQEWLAGPTSQTKGMFAPVSIRQGEDGGLVVVTVEMKALLHDTREAEPTRYVEWTVENGSTTAEFGYYHAGDEIVFTADEGYRYVLWSMNGGDEYAGDVRDGKWTYTVQDIEAPQNLRITFSMYEP